MPDAVPIVGKYRVDLTDMPPRIRRLSVFRGYPVPWFVAWLPSGEPEFRAMDPDKFARAVNEKLCWVCGLPLTVGQYTFVAGPMCGVNRTSAEPPCHDECADWSARNCPFLSRPRMHRRENAMPEGAKCSPFAIERNPGVTLLWTCRGYRTFGDGHGTTLLHMEEAFKTRWYREGRKATRAEIDESISAGLPLLREQCKSQGDSDELDRLVAGFQKYLPTF